MNAGAEIGHQVAEGAGLPPFVESLERLRHAIGGRGDLVGVDRVALPAELRAWESRVPKDQCLAMDEALLHGRYIGRRLFLLIDNSRAWPEGCTLNYVHFRPILACYMALI